MRSAAAARAEGIAMIDLEKLAIEAGRADVDGNCVVTRRWLRQVLKELRAARAPRSDQAAALDLNLPKLEVVMAPRKVRS
jgi:hypothetical protein